MKKKVQTLLKTGKRYDTSFFRVHLKSSDIYKAGFIANRRAGQASERTRIKRIIREFWRMNFRTGNFLFILKPGVKKADREKILRELEKTADRIKCADS